MGQIAQLEELAVKQYLQLKTKDLAVQSLLR